MRYCWKLGGGGWYILGLEDELEEKASQKSVEGMVEGDTFLNYFLGFSFSLRRKVSLFGLVRVKVKGTENVALHQGGFGCPWNFEPTMNIHA